MRKCHSTKLDKHTPADRDVLLALVTMNRDAGNLDDARSYAQALRLRYSDDPETRRAIAYALARRDHPRERPATAPGGTDHATGGRRHAARQ